MKVLKFGGTSVGSPERMQQVLDIICREEGKKIVVLSAMAGTTNELKHIASLLQKDDLSKAKYQIFQLKEEYNQVVRRLFQKKEYILAGEAVINKYFDVLEVMLHIPYSDKIERVILAQGELISTGLFHILCQDNEVESVLLPALDIMKTNRKKNPDYGFIKNRMKSWLNRNPQHALVITQGYICKNHFGEIDNLGRGGSDYTATILGGLLKAEEIQIWTDIDGLHNNDPRYVDRTSPVPTLGYEAAKRLAYYGAKILHPACVIPAQKALVPLRIKNTFDPEATGTSIYNTGNDKVAAIASAKDQETLITVKSNYSLPFHQFIGRVFDLFQHACFEIDMVSVSNPSISVAVTSQCVSDELIEELEKLGFVAIENDFSIITLIGDFQPASEHPLDSIFKAVETIPISMITQKNDTCNYLQFLVKSKFKLAMLEQLNRNVLNKVEAPAVVSSIF